MLKKILFLIIGFTLPLIARAHICKGTSSYNLSNVCENNISSLPFQDGENIMYKFYYKISALWIPTGELKYSVSSATLQNQANLLLKSHLATFPAYHYFLKAAFDCESYIFTNKVLPISHSFKQENNTDVWEHKSTFMHAQQKVLVDYLKQNGKTVMKNRYIPIEANTQDFVSFVYYARSLAKENGESVNGSIYLGDSILYNLTLNYIGKETVKSDKGKFRCLKYSLKLANFGVFDAGNEMTVWVSDDENHLPVRIQSPMRYGSLQIWLTNYTGLKYPSTSKLN